MPDRGTFITNTTVETDTTGDQSPFVTLLASGTWGGATLKLQAGFVGAAEVTQWVDITGASLAANGCVSVAIQAHKLRVNCAGGTAHDIKWAVVG